MSDFYSKKQKKYWCNNCRIFIEYNKVSIEKHNSSRNHLNNVASEGKYKSIKKKYDSYITGLNESNSKGDDLNADKLLGRKSHRSNINEQYNRESAAYLKEIKSEMMKEQVKTMHKSKDEGQKKIWGVFWDETYSLPYYYNFLTGESVWEKPSDYDGTQEEIDKLIADARRPHSENIKDESKGLIGKWEKVEKEKSILGQRKSEDE